MMKQMYIVLLGMALLVAFTQSESLERTARKSHDEFEQEMLTEHNTYRKRHCAKPLQIDADLTEAAQHYAEHLAKIDKMVHDKEKIDSGENLYATTGDDINGKVVTDKWYNEVTAYNYKTGPLKKGTGHFTQAVWKGSKKFGAGFAKSKTGKTYVVARYRPAGNMKGEYQKNVVAKC